MTRRQYQNHRQGQPRPTAEQRRAAHEANLLHALEKIGWRVEKREPFKLYLAKAG